MDAINLKKDTANGQVFDSTRYNLDQTAVEDAINLLTQSSDEDDSGADHIKISPVSGTAATTVMGLLKYILSLGSGSLPGDGTITNAKMATDAKIGSLAALTTTAKASIVAAIIEIVASLATDAGNLSTHISDQAKHTDIMTTEGDMIGHNGTTRARIPKGTARKVLGMNAAATGQEYIESLQSLMTAAGDLLYASAANTPARLAKGTAYQHLGMNSGATAQEWQASLQSLMTAAGDLIYGSAANTPARLAKGTDGQFLKQVAGVPAWATLDFTAVTDFPGYQKLPSGLIIQFGVEQNVTTSSATVTFPIAFPNQIFCVTFGQEFDASTDPGMGISSTSTTNFVVDVQAGTKDCHWIAIGY